MKILEKLHKIEEAKTIYDIHYCRAGVGIVFYYPEKIKGQILETIPDNWREGLSCEQYYETFEKCIEAEYKKLSFN